MSTLRIPTEKQRRLDADFDFIFGSSAQSPRPVPTSLADDEVLELEAEQAQVRG